LKKSKVLLSKHAKNLEAPNANFQKAMNE